MNKVSLFCVLLFNGVVSCSEEFLDVKEMQLDPVCPTEINLLTEEDSDTETLDTLDLSDLGLLNDTIRCEVCNKHILNDKYNMHMSAHRANPSKTYHCQASTTCINSFTSLTALAKHHETIHNKGKRLYCRTCSVWAALSTYHLYHREEHTKQPHKPVPWNVQKCPTCFMMFKKKHHSRTHTGILINCDWSECTFSSDSYQTMQRHREKEHETNGTRWCTCKKCKKKSNQEGSFIPYSTYFKHKNKYK